MRKGSVFEQEPLYVATDDEFALLESLRVAAAAREAEAAAASAAPKAARPTLRARAAGVAAGLLG